MKIGINHNVSEADYHAFPAVSKSTLFAFAPNPRRWHLTKDLPRNPTDSMAWGSLVDCLLLQPAELDKSFAVSPYQSYRTKEAQAWRDAQTLPIIDETMIEEARQAVDAARQNRFVAEIMDGAELQVSLLLNVDNPDYGPAFPAKCRIDIVPAKDGPHGDSLVDLKTIDSLSLMSQRINDFCYHGQAAFYLDSFNTVTGEERHRWKFIFIERKFPFEVAVVELDQEDIADGRDWYCDALKKWAECQQTNHYPSPWEDEIKIISRPFWAKRR